jgi:enolase-phosphatase E1
MFALVKLKDIRVILLDIEGTTTPVDFVYKTLFPFARARLRGFLEQHASDEETQKDILQLRAEHAADVENGLNPPPPSEKTIESLAVYLQWLMDKDRKSTPLKSIQGKIWEEGYRTGELVSEIFNDVPRAFNRWREDEKIIAIYSSGSRLAQKLLFAHTNTGDLTSFISNYFDTNIGGKKETESYRRIADELSFSSSEILFISDSSAELDAAKEAEMQTVLSMRPGNAPLTNLSNHPVIHSFDEIM